MLNIFYIVAYFIMCIKEINTMSTLRVFVAMSTLRVFVALQPYWKGFWLVGYFY